MIIIRIILSMFGVGFFCWLLFTLAVYALPFFAGLFVGLAAFHSGAGVIGALIVGVLAGGATLGRHRMICAAGEPGAGIRARHCNDGTWPKAEWRVWRAQRARSGRPAIGMAIGSSRRRSAVTRSVGRSRNRTFSAMWRRQLRAQARTRFAGLTLRVR
jgi:hypothetical protein